MKKGFLLLVFTFSLFLANAQIVITEIMYNPPEDGQDSLEYIELYNNSANSIDLEGYTFAAGVEYTFPVSTPLAAGAFLIVSEDSVALQNNFGVAALQWTDNGLSNGGEAIVLADANGVVVDSVDYDDSNGWPPNADGLGASLVLCDFDADNTDPANWASATTGTGVIINAIEVFANPNGNSECQGGAVIRFLDSGMEVDESAGTVSVDIGIFGNTSDMMNTVMVSFGIGSSATVGQDFMFTPATVNFAVGVEQDTQTVTIDIIDDMDPESIEAVILELSNAGGGASIDPVNSSYNLQIADNDTEVPALVISEIMYNNPGTDEYEYLEIFNNDSEAVNMEGYTFTEGIEFTFPAFTLMPGEYVVLATDSVLFEMAYGITPFQFEGALNNGGEDVELRDAGGNVVDIVDYLPDTPWDSDANGTGAPLILCDVDADNNDPANWQASNTDSGVVVNGVSVNGSPGADNDCQDAQPTTYPPYAIGTVTTNNTMGQADSIGVTCQLQGIVYGENIRPGGLQFTLIDDQNDGIHIFSNSVDFGYTVVEGDEVIVQGTISQFNGLTQINPDTVYSVSSGNALFDPTPVTTLDESTESQLVNIMGLEIVDPTEWTNSGSGFNVKMAMGTDTVEIRIDADVDIFGTMVETYAGKVLSVTGLGGQFDGTAAFDEGYQLLPRYLDDIQILSSVSEAEFEQGIKLFPNPASEQLTIEMNLEIEAVQLTNILGQSLDLRRFSTAWDSNRIQLDVSDLVSGIYFLTFTSEGSTWTTEFIRK